MISNRLIKDKKWVEIKQSRQAQFIFPGIIALIGFLFVWITILPFGPSINFHEDGFHYLWTSTLIYSVDGLRQLIYFPPLHSMLISLPQLIGISPVTSGGLVGALGFALLMFVCSEFLLRHTQSFVLFVLGAFSIFFSTELIRWYMNTFSGGIFTLLYTLCVFFLIRYIKQSDLKNLLALSAITALCALHRYIGTIAIMSGFFIILSPLIKKPLMDRLREAILFGFIASLPVIL